ncbi:GNAT family N-acetyltransferase [Allobranchiibius huperziae]|uniref:Ribosomal-protein-alanine N-acetyltransferase n=1 Tax=Allobranchiibius huperziae TaxID=1874116 RepID=A0A853D9N2_9MICO|nr:GNAT family protein [Allobranchiibius huperziae]NYJ73668.1 ribosomal-protein-alanine N-acetyltransferase [Allobranchiibius huperziae]
MSDRPWPIAIAGDWRGMRIMLRPLRARADRAEFVQLRAQNAAWTREWDSTSPIQQAPVSFAQMVRQQDRLAARGELLPFAVAVDGELVGQMHLFNIVRGALRSAGVGYWISQRYAGRGITPYALATAIDHAFGTVGLHRVEVNIRPENHSSLAVVRKLELRDEGLRRAYLHINGQWRDHRTFAVVREDLAAGETMVGRLRATYPEPV